MYAAPSLKLLVDSEGYLFLRCCTHFRPVKQDQTMRVYIQTDLWCAIVGDPTARTQPLGTDLHQTALADILCRHICEAIPAIHPHPEGLFLATASLAVDRDAEAGNLLLTNDLHLRLTAHIPCQREIQTCPHDVEPFRASALSSIDLMPIDDLL